MLTHLPLRLATLLFVLQHDDDDITALFLLHDPSLGEPSPGPSQTPYLRIATPFNYISGGEKSQSF